MTQGKRSKLTEEVRSKLTKEKLLLRNKPGVTEVGFRQFPALSSEAARLQGFEAHRKQNAYYYFLSMWMLQALPMVLFTSRAKPDISSYCVLIRDSFSSLFPCAFSCWRKLYALHLPVGLCS